MTTGELLADKAKIAQDFKARSVGLLNRESLEKGEALVIKPCNSIHMFFMRFPIDAVFLDKNNKVVKTYESLKPWRLASCLFGGYFVIEFPGGTFKNTKISKSDQLSIELIT